jgi:hypothetical protein
MYNIQLFIPHILAKFYSFRLFTEFQLQLICLTSGRQNLVPTCNAWKIHRAGQFTSIMLNLREKTDSYVKIQPHWLYVEQRKFALHAEVVKMEDKCSEHSMFVSQASKRSC